MIDFLSQEQKDRLFERLITSASDILSEELGLPKRTFQELQEMFEQGEQNMTDLFPVPDALPV